MRKVKAFVFNRRYFFIVFFGVCAYYFIAVMQCRFLPVTDLLYAFYVLDFGMGFASRILPGAVFRMIVRDPSQTSATVYHYILLGVFLFLLSVLMEKFLLSFSTEQRKLCGLIVFLFFTGSLTFTMFAYNIGMLEFYWVFLALFFFVFLAYKPLQPLILPICVLEILVNSSAIICWVPLFCILLLYKLSFAEKKSEKIWLCTLFSLCTVVTLSLFFYLMMFEQKNMVYSFEEFHEILVERGVKYYTYPEYFLYKQLNGQLSGEVAEMLPQLEQYGVPSLMEQFEQGQVLPGLQSFIAAFVMEIKTVLALRSIHRWDLFACVLLVHGPVLFLILRFLFGSLREKRFCRLRRFSYFCMGALFFVTYGLSIFLSTDNVKWLAFSFGPLFAAFLYVMFTEKERVTAYLIKTLSSVPFPVMLIYASVYAGTIVGPYH